MSPSYKFPQPTPPHYFASTSSPEQQSASVQASMPPSWSTTAGYSNNNITLSPSSDCRESIISNSTMSPITPGARSPPTSPGQQDALMNLDPFGQLSLSPGRGNTNGMANGINSNMTHNNFAMASVNINNSASSSPKSPMQQSGSHTSSTTLNANSFNSQPMVVSPDHGAGTLVPSAQQSNVYDPFQGYGISPQSFVQGQNNQHFEQQQQPVNQFQQHHSVQQTYRNSIPQQIPPNQPQMVRAHVSTNQTQLYANYTYNNASVVNNSSPPVSPLYTPASPQSNQQRQTPVVPNSPPPSLPTGNPFDDAFGTSSAGASNFSHVSGTSADPFGADAFVGGTTASVAANGTNNNSNSNNVQDEADFWEDMGFGVNPSGNANNNTAPTNKTTIQAPSSPSNTSNSSRDTEPVQNEEPLLLDANNLPTRGEYYTARVTKPLLGAIFSSGQELRNTLYSSASDRIVDAIGDRPVVSFTIDGSAADTAGIQLGHVLIKVNGEEVMSTDDAVKMVGKSPRPLKMEMYIPPDVKVVKTEGQYMVKYDSNSTEAPSTCTEWKPKYVVAGDMLGKPHMLYMYRSKAEYDIAVKEAQIPGKVLSVKVKQFDIRGARILNETGQVRYPGKGTWYYFTVVRSFGLPIKISATRPEDLTPVYDGIMAFLERESKRRMDAAAERRERYTASYSAETYY
mmetsp:Transcript_23576/g.46993  ORF Transcript_23576/g.46993 Transcript_23576/m.46993 type:complete len:682 (-) Transcript_23576:331-2376(-)